MEGGLSTHRGEVGVSVVLYQVDHDVHVTHEGGNMEWGQARLKKKKKILFMIRLCFLYYTQYFLIDKVIFLIIPVVKRDQYMVNYAFLTNSI